MLFSLYYTFLHNIAYTYLAWLLCGYGSGEAETHLRLIAEVVPKFLSIIRLKSGEYVKIDQLADLASVHDSVQNIIKAM